MEPIPCLGCSIFFTPRNRVQMYCSHPDCQKKRKSLWQKNKKKNDSEYRENQHLSQQKWLQSRPEYWKNYRDQKSEKTERNRKLQRIRNHRARKKSEPPEVTLIAKMDARKFFDINLESGFWIVPMIAKMDVAKINFHLIPIR